MEYDGGLWHIRCEAGALVWQEESSPQLTRMNADPIYVHPQLLSSYLPKITQSPCDVPMKNNIGSDSQVFVLEAIKAWRASSGGAAGPVPAVPASMRLLLGQIIPQTFSSITMPYV